MIKIGMAGGMATGGQYGRRVHLLQPSSIGNLWVPLCRVDCVDSRGAPLENKGINDVSCKKCQKLARILRRPGFFWRW